MLIKKIKNLLERAKIWNENRQVLRALRKELKKRKIPDYYYNLRQRGRHDERFSIARLEDGGWEVYYMERGGKTTDRIFDTAEAACRYMISELTDMK